jgi:ankyrin repeat protein
MQHVHKDWLSAEDFLVYVADLFPFHPDWPDSGPISVHSAMADGDTPLHVASAWGDAKAVELLLSAGALVNQAGDMELTALHAATKDGHVEVADLLLRGGANPHVKSGFGTSPYQIAMNEGNPELRGVFASYAGP